MTVKTRSVNWGALAAIAAFAALGWQIWTHFNAPKRTVEATYVFNDFSWPPSVDSVRRPRSAFGIIGGYARIDVRNVGTLAARGVIVRVPYLEMWCLNREAEREICRHSAGRIDVGDLAVGEAVTVRAWTTQQPSRYDAVSVAHAEGVGHATRVPFIRELSWSERNTAWIVWLGLITTGLFLVTGEIARQLRKREEQARTAQTIVETEQVKGSPQASFREIENPDVVDRDRDRDA